MATWNWVNIGPGNGLLPDSTKPLSEPMLTCHQQSPVAFILEHYDKIKRHQSVKKVWELHFQHHQFVVNRVTSHEHKSVLFLWPLDCLLKTLFMLTTKKHQSFASLSLLRGMHWWPVDSHHKGPVRLKAFPSHNHHAVLVYVLHSRFTSRVKSASLRMIWIAVFLKPSGSDNGLWQGII